MKSILIKKNSYYFFSQLSSLLLHGYRDSCAGLEPVTIDVTYFLLFSWLCWSNFQISDFWKTIKNQELLQKNIGQEDQNFYCDTDLHVNRGLNHNFCVIFATFVI